MMRNSLSSSSVSSEASWEERAFAQDINNNVHASLGCAWPPKSYLCTFCMREFASAQALGGHMNIHRRDRARLKHFYAANDLTLKSCSFRGRRTQPRSVVVPSVPLCSVNTARVSAHASYYLSHHPTQRVIDEGGGDCVETDLYLGLNVDNPVAARHFSKPYHLGSEVYSYEADLRSNIKDDLDLELRLGRRDPKIMT